MTSTDTPQGQHGAGLLMEGDTIRQDPSETIVPRQAPPPQDTLAAVDALHAEFVSQGKSDRPVDLGPTLGGGGMGLVRLGTMIEANPPR